MLRARCSVYQIGTEVCPRYAPRTVQPRQTERCVPAAAASGMHQPNHRTMQAEKLPARPFTHYTPYGAAAPQKRNSEGTITEGEGRTKVRIYSLHTALQCACEHVAGWAAPCRLPMPQPPVLHIPDSVPLCDSPESDVPKRTEALTYATCLARVATRTRIPASHVDGSVLSG